MKNPFKTNELRLKEAIIKQFPHQMKTPFTENTYDIAIHLIKYCKRLEDHNKVMGNIHQKKVEDQLSISQGLKAQLVQVLKSRLAIDGDESFLKITNERFNALCKFVGYQAPKASELSGKSGK